MAIRIEVDTENQNRISRCLPQIHKSISIQFPLGMPMRLISEFREIKGYPMMIGKYMRLRVRQASFNHLTISHPNDLLDYEATSCGKTLQSTIMSI